VAAFYLLGEAQVVEAAAVVVVQVDLTLAIANHVN